MLNSLHFHFSNKTQKGGIFFPISLDFINAPVILGYTKWTLNFFFFFKNILCFIRNTSKLLLCSQTITTVTFFYDIWKYQTFIKYCTQILLEFFKELILQENIKIVRYFFEGVRGGGWGGVGVCEGKLVMKSHKNDHYLLNLLVFS